MVLRFVDQLRGIASIRLAPGPAELGTLMGDVSIGLRSHGK